MQAKQFVSRVTALAAPLCEQQGLTLWDVTFEKEGAKMMLTVFIDKEGGVFIEDCETLSRALDPLLDAGEFNSLPAYTLCVSSAGLERKLTKPAHFAWARGKQVTVSFYKSQNGAHAITGTLVDKTEDGVVLEQNGAQLSIADGDIASIRLYFEF